MNADLLVFDVGAGSEGHGSTMTQTQQRNVCVCVCVRVLCNFGGACVWGRGGVTGQ